VHGSPSLLVEREREVAALRAAAARAAAGDGQLVIVEGAPGVGKSALAAAAAEAGRAAGLGVLVARAGELERDVPFGVVRVLLEPLAQPALAAGRMHEAARRVFEVGAGVSDEIPAVVPGLGVLVAELATAADGRGLALVVDDGHWADAASLRLIAHLLLRLPALALLLVVVTRSREAGGGGVLDVLRADPDAVVLEPQPLSPSGVAEVVRATFAADAAEEFCSACARASGGNAFLLAQLLLGLSAAGVPARAEDAVAVESIVPRGVRAEVSARLARLPAPAPAGAFADALAVLGDGTPLRRVAALAALDLHTAEDAGEALARAGVTHPGEPPAFAHPLLAAAVGEGLEGFQRGRLHRRAAVLLDGDGEPPLRLAAHLLHAPPAGDPWVVRTLCAAAADAAALDDVAHAVRLLERAIAEPPAKDERAAVRVEHALAQAHAGAPTAIEAVRGALSVVEEPGDRLALLRELARVQWLSGNLDAAAATGRDALAQAPPGHAGHDEVLAELLAELLAVVLMHRFSDVPADPRLLALVERAARGWVPASAGLAAALATVLALSGWDVRLVAPLIERALTGDPFRRDAAPYGLALDFIVAALLFSDQPDRAAQLVEQALGEARHARDPIRLGHWSYLSAEAGRRLGRLDEAVGDATAAIDAAGGRWASWLGFSVATLVEAHLDRGDVPAAQLALAIADGRVPIDQVAGAAVQTAHGRLLSELGRPQEALDVFLETERRLDALGRRDGPSVPWRPGAALAAQQAGEADLAWRLAEEELIGARAAAAPARLGGALRVAAAVGDAEQRIERLREAVSVLRRSPARVERAAALAALGAALRRAGERLAAREPLAEALSLADACSAADIAGYALAELHAAGARPRRRARSGPDALTSAERRVAELAARGLANRAIAAQLVLSTRTVEWQLARAFAKLGVRSRQELSVELPDAKSQ